MRLSSISFSHAFITLIFICILIYYLVSNVCNTPKDTYKEINDIKLKEDINFPYVQETVDSYPTHLFDNDHIYIESQVPKTSLRGETKKLLDGIVDNAAAKLKLSSSDFSHGNYRVLIEGIEFNLLFNNSQRRITVFQPLSKALHMNEIPVAKDKEVSIILPLKGKLLVFEKFLDNLISRILPVEKNIDLTVVYFADESTDKARSLLRSKFPSSAFPYFHWNFVVVEDGAFSRGKGIRIGVMEGKRNPQDLMFICDVDVFITPEFFMNCRSNAVYGHQVYFPILFSLYNPKLVYPIKEDSVPSFLDQMTVGSDNGFWRHYGFGMFCMHRKEYDAVGGVPELSTWGREDLMFYEKFGSYSSLKIIRSFDTSIFHMYHPKNCSDVSNLSYPSCLGSKATNEGTQKQLGMVLMKLQEGIDIEGILSKRFYYFYWFPVLLSVICLLLLTNVYLMFVS